MSAGIAYRFMQPDDAAVVSDLLMRTFMAFVAPDYSAQGVQTFSAFVQPRVLRDRLTQGALVLLATAGASIVGMIEMDQCNHVTLLFVVGAYQRRGISRELLRRALDLCRQRQPNLTQVTVNSSPYAVEVYKRLGFTETDSAQERDGILFIPMRLELV